MGERVMGRHLLSQLKFFSRIIFDLEKLENFFKLLSLCRKGTNMRSALFLLWAALALFQRTGEATHYSQALQDKMVSILLYGFLEKQDPGYYLEIGAGEPIYINNSYFFEKHLNWKGVSLDISQGLVEKWRAARKNPLRIEDALTADYTEILQPFPKTLDYLSLDVDGQYVDVLKRVPFEAYIFKVITIEHDFYRFGELYREEERRILQSLGYHLLCPDVSHSGFSFEDWWIHPSFFSSSQLAALSSLDLQAKDCEELIDTLQNALLSFQEREGQ
jgi:hypothetical protein